MAADYADRLHQALFRFAHFAAVEGQHADRLPFGDHRKKDGSMQADFANEGYLCGANVFPHIGQPQRLARLPHTAGKAGTRGVCHAA